MARPPASGGGRRADLHAHTHFSDGALSPEALIAHALSRGLAAVSVTDHDSIDGLAAARAAAGGLIEFVPGIEISTALDGQELHILGYYLDPDDAALRERLVRFRSERLNRALSMVRRLGEIGVPVAPDEVLAIAGPGVVGRPHVAEALLRAGHVVSVDDAFRRYLGVQGEAYVPRPAFRPAEAIGMIHDAGGVSVLAHPGMHLTDLVADQLVAAGLRGVEVWHPQHGSQAMQRWRAFARRHRLLETGGSDFHTPGRNYDLGDLPVPAGVVDALKRAAGVAG